MDAHVRILDEANLTRMIEDFAREGMESPTIDQLLSGEASTLEFVAFHRAIFDSEIESDDNSEEEFVQASFSKESTKKKQAKPNPLLANPHLSQQILQQFQQVQPAVQQVPVFQPLRIGDPAHIAVFMQQIMAMPQQQQQLPDLVQYPFMQQPDQINGLAQVLGANRIWCHLESKPSIQIFRDLLFVASHQRRHHSDSDLIDVDRFSGETMNLDKSLTSEDVCVAVSVDHRNDITYKINNNEDAKKRLYELSPFVQHLVEKGAFADGSICIGGGAAMWAIRGIASAQEIIQGDHLPEDIDFFIIGGPADKDKYGKVCVSAREAIAQKIYETFLTIVDVIYRQNYSDSYGMVIMRNRDCTTIILTPKKFTESNRFMGLTQPAKRRQMKLQIIHRLYSHLAEVPKGFDLAASQFVFTGDKFYGTYAGMISVGTNVIPLDISRASKSWAMRLWKYSREKNFQLAFMGMNKTDVKAKVTNKKRIFFDYGFSLKLAYNHGDAAASITIIYSLLDKKTNDKMKRPDGDRDMFDWNEMAATDYEFGTHKAVKDLESVSEANLDALLKGASVYATSAWELFENCSRSQPLSQIQSFLRDEVVLPESIDELFTDRCHTKNNIPRENFMLLFGARAAEAGACYFNEDQHGYDEVVGKRLSELLEEAESQIDSLKVIQWKVISPGDQDYGAFNHIDLTARSFYGPPYNGFLCTNMWRTKLPIIIAVRRRGTSKAEKNCPLVDLLPKDLIKMIFTWVDHLTIQELTSSLR